MNSGKGNIILLTIISVATLLVSVMGTSSLLFSLSADKHTSEVVDSSGNLSMCSSGRVSTNFGNAAIGGSNFEPGATVGTKTFTVTASSINSENLKYEAFLFVKNNTYSNGALQYTINCIPSNNIGSPIPKSTGKINSGSNFKISLGKGTFGGPLSESDNPLHTCTLTITFVNTGGDQTADANKTFSAEVRVN